MKKMVLLRLLSVNLIIFMSNFYGVSGGYSRIVNGYGNSMEKVPYIIQLSVANQVICGGSIVTERHVVTAAHCLDFDKSMLRRYPISILTGSIKRGQGTSYQVEDFNCNERFNGRTVDYDACVIKIRDKFKFDNNCKPIKLASTSISSYIDKEAMVSGYGRTSHNGPMATKLQSVGVKIFPPNYCRQAYGSIITERMICAGHREGGKDACVGDSGGPLVIDNELRGIVSFGKICADRRSPGVYADVFALKDWIERQLN